ncbi:hypothetical protein ACWA7J_10985 [Leptothrix sp. BB-4]
MSYLSLILLTPALPVAALSLLFLGAYAASVHPFQSLMAIQQFGLSPSAYSGVLVLASAVAVTASVLLGMLGDRHANRRMLAILTSSVGTFGLGLMVVAPGPVTFVFCHGFAVPVTAALAGQYYALARLALSHRPEARTAVLSALRACMSLTFLLAMLVWKLFLGGGGALLHVYWGAFAVSAATTLALVLRWPRDGETHWEDAPSGLNWGQAFREILRKPVMVRLAMMGSVSSVPMLYTSLLPLIFAATPERNPGDSALYMGIVAGWEVPVMLTLPMWGRGFSRSRLLVAGGLLYSLHLVLLQGAAASPLVWGLTFMGGATGALIFSLQITYLQDLLHERPGTAGALLAIQKLFGDLLASAVFALGAQFGSFHTTALIGGAVGCLGALGLLVADRHAEPSSPPPKPAD